ncbi:MAG: DUF3857 domain-containing protein [Ferruginibacter sp.]|nr:DUF3857 domain-containing protein [Ferruginibacter sp.]
MKTILLTLGFTCVFCQLFSQNKFDVSTIPDALKKHAGSVAREERTDFEVKEPGKATMKIHKVVTVLNQNGKDELAFQAWVDKFHSLESVAIQVFDSKGEPGKKYKRSDLQSQMTGEGLVPDGKVYYLEVPTVGYPVTIQFDYELGYTGLLQYPAYQIQHPGQSVENSVYNVSIPENLDLRYKAKNTNLVPVATTAAGIKTYSWSAKQLPALETEAGSVTYRNYFPQILLAPNKFEMGGYVGDMSSWESFGKWNALLLTKANNLSDARKEFFRNLVKDAPDDRSKVRIIYRYLQSNFRYVSIQLGMGGFIPFEADFVDKKKYGDCKALSNYTMASLAAVGIKSHYALINSDYNSEPVDADFPIDRFNHIILCVPQQKDTIWLECTSSTNEFAVLGNFTENKNALLITENGGKLVATPKSKAAHNIYGSTSLVTLAEDGSGIVQASLTSSGEFRDLVDYLGTQKKDEQKRILVDYLDYMDPDEFEVRYDTSNKSTPLGLALSFEKIPEFIAGKKLFLNPRVYKIWNTSLPSPENRKKDYYFKHPFIKMDTTVYKLPEGFSIETLPKAKNVKFEFGSFNSTYQYDEAKREVMSCAKLQLDEYKIPPAKFEATAKFFNEVLTEYTEKIVIKRL